MPQIPLYNKGLGSTGVTTGGSLGPRASTGAFTGVGQELAKFGEVAGNMMYEYYDADKKAEAKSSIAAAENELNEKLEIYNDTDKTTNAETYDKQYKANSTKYINEVSSKYNLRPNEQKLLVARLADLSAGKHQEGRRKVSAKQDAIRGYNQGTALDRNINAMVTNAVGTPLHEKARKDAINGIVEAGQGNTLRFLSVKNLDELNLVVEEKTFTTRTNGATTTEDISKIREDLTVSNLTPEKIATQEERLKTKETAVINNTIADIVTTATVQQDFEGFEPDTVISEEERLAVIDKYLKGDYSSNPSAKEKYESLSVKDQARVNAALVTLRANEQTQIKWEENRKETNEDNRNDEIYTDTVEKIKNGNISITEINKLPFEGAKGEVLRQSLVTKESNRLSGKVLTDSKPLAYSETQEKMFTDELTSVTQKFILKSDPQGAKPKNILERVGIDFSSDDANKFESYLRNKKNAAVSSEAKELVQAEKFFQDFLKGNADFVKGSKMMARIDPKSDQDFFDFQMQMRGRFSAGLAKGIDAKELLNPRNKNYILNADDLYGKTSQQSIQNIVDFYKKKPALTLEDVKPPQKPGTMSVEDWLKSDTWQNYITSSKWKKYKALQGEPN
jgi:hypothetical protein